MPPFCITTIRISERPKGACGVNLVNDTARIYTFPTRQQWRLPSTYSRNNNVARPVDINSKAKGVHNLLERSHIMRARWL